MTITQEAGRECTGYHQITDLTSATGVRGAGGACLIQAEGGAVRWRADGTNPTASVGMLLNEDDSMWYVGDLSKLNFINDSGSTATLNLTTFK